jgi:hypothetical protein
MHAARIMTSSTFKLPSAWLPIAMSSIALALVSGNLLVLGAAREADEGAVAHLWQLLMSGQLPVIGWFAIRWFRRDQSQALRVLAVQATAYVVALAPVALFGL